MVTLQGGRLERDCNWRLGDQKGVGRIVKKSISVMTEAGGISAVTGRKGTEESILKQNHNVM